ncbi:MAG: hydroxyisourate hydrolase [Chloroflexota bacterium]|nr:hydroxyisourate hydrolase [Chloroflexota bacterium]
MTTLSTHVLDIERGVPAVDVAIAVYRERECIAAARTNEDGRVPDLARLEAGAYRIEFDAAGYFAARGVQSPFLRRVSLEFQVDANARHYHLPLLLSPYACTSYRGS